MNSIMKNEETLLRLFAEDATTADRVRFINENLPDGQAPVTAADIGYESMGEIIARYTLAKKQADRQMEEQADAMLDDKFERVSYDMPFCLGNGLFGLGCGLIYLLENGFVEGDEDEILSCIDDMAFRKIIHFDGKEEMDWQGWLRYFRLRTAGPCNESRRTYRLVFRQHTIYLLDCLLRHVRKGKNIDGPVVEEVEAMHKAEVCPETTFDILSLSALQSNRTVSFVIPVRVDSVEREQNLDLIIEQLAALGDSIKVEIRILEADDRPHYEPKVCCGNIHKTFVEDTAPVFHRTKYLNRLIQEAEGAVVGVWDTDVLMPQSQILEAIEAIRRGNAVMSFPYDGRFYMLPPEESGLLKRRETKVEDYCLKIHEYVLAHGPNSVGGAFLVNKKAYVRYGGENQHFYGWGPEDAERCKRMEILGLPVFRSQGPLLHLFHPRMQNSWFGSKELEYANRMEFVKVAGMTKSRLLQYISEWES